MKRAKSNRVRYFKNEDGSWVSTRIIKTTIGNVIVKFWEDPIKAQIIIVNKGGDLEVKETIQAERLWRLKELIKERLISMGASFKRESRESS